MRIAKLENAIRNKTFQHVFKIETYNLKKLNISTL